MKSKHYEVASLLSRFGADPRIADDKGFTALDIYYGVYDRYMDNVFMQRIDGSTATGLISDSYLNDDYSSDIY